jgi:putative spermidine/putrescine transport system substrate-binding protein
VVKNKFAKIMILAILTLSILLSFSGCWNNNKQNPEVKQVKTPQSLAELTRLARQEGKVVSLGMPDDWANWKDAWAALKTDYGISHTDTDMSSAEEISKLEAEKSKPTADIGDVGIVFGPVAAEKGLTLPYKTSYFDEIPDWAKDKDGNWVVAYTGTIAIITNKKLVKNPPKSWEDLLKGNYTIATDDVTKSAQGQATVLAAALAYGGDEKNIKPGLDFFAKIAKQGRLSLVNPSISMLEMGEVEVALLWDFSALERRDKVDPDGFEVCIPEEGSITSGYTTIINKYGLHPYSAMLVREYILSDEGQINFARGYARPIRSSVELPKDVKAKLLPDEQYKNAEPITDISAWSENAKQLPQLWQEEVLVYAE